MKLEDIVLFSTRISHTTGATRYYRIDLPNKKYIFQLDRLALQVVSGGAPYAVLYVGLGSAEYWCTDLVNQGYGYYLHAWQPIIIPTGAYFKLQVYTAAQNSVLDLNFFGRYLSKG